MKWSFRRDYRESRYYDGILDVFVILVMSMLGKVAYTLV